MERYRSKEQEFKRIYANSGKLSGSSVMDIIMNLNANEGLTRYVVRTGADPGTGATNAQSENLSKISTI